MNADSFERLAHVLDTIESEGATLVNVDVTEVTDESVGARFAAAMTGRPKTETVYDLRIAVSGVDLTDGEAETAQGDAADENEDVPIELDEQADDGGDA